MLQYYHIMRTREKNPLARILYSKITLVFILIACVFLAMSVYERFTIEREMAERRHEAETERAALIERKQELTEKVEYLSAERGIEAEMRNNFDVAREGEQVVVIIDDEPTDRATTAAMHNTATTTKSFWSRFLPW